jgi:hypothetical protein
VVVKIFFFNDNLIAVPPLANWYCFLHYRPRNTKLISMIPGTIVANNCLTSKKSGSSGESGLGGPLTSWSCISAAIPVDRFDWPAPDTPQYNINQSIKIFCTDKLCQTSCARHSALISSNCKILLNLTDYLSDEIPVLTVLDIFIWWISRFIINRQIRACKLVKRYQLWCRSSLTKIVVFCNEL